MTRQTIATATATAQDAARKARRRLPAVVATAILYATMSVRTLVVWLGSGQEGSIAQLGERDGRRTAMLVGAGAGLLALAVWLAWFLSVYDAVRALGVARHDRVMSVLAWLVPWVNLVIPKRLVNDVWRAGGREPVPGVVKAWWVLWVAGSLAFPFGLAIPVPLEVLKTMMAGLLVATALLAIRTAQVLTRRVEAIAARAPAIAFAAWPGSGAYSAGV